MIDAAFVIYLIGLPLFARATLCGLDELHALRDERGIGADIVRSLGWRWGHVWIDLVGTLALIFWPLMMLGGIYITIKKRL